MLGGDRYCKENVPGVNGVSRSGILLSFGDCDLHFNSRKAWQVLDVGSTYVAVEMCKMKDEGGEPIPCHDQDTINFKSLHTETILQAEPPHRARGIRSHCARFHVLVPQPYTKNNMQDEHETLPPLRT